MVETFFTVWLFHAHEDFQPHQSLNRTELYKNELKNTWLKASGF
jgi:hypothetical protein